MTLGRIAVESTGEPFAEQLRSRIFAPCGMTSASTPYDATLMPRDLSQLDIAPFWVGGHELSHAHAVSLDWAGGNVAATTGDFARFARALRVGELISQDSLAHLTRARRRFRRGIHYGTGTMTMRFDEFAPPFWRGLPRPVGHIGIWAAHVFWYPEHDAQVVLNFHSTRAMQQSVQLHAAIAAEIAATNQG